MPTYEYQCLACEEKVEYFQSFHEAPETICPACGGKLVRLVSSGAGLIFKGSGFYITDYKKSNSSGANGNNGHNGHNEKSDKNDKHEAGETAEKSVTAEKGEKPTKLRYAENESSKPETKPAEKNTVTEQK